MTIADEPAVLDTSVPDVEEQMAALGITLEGLKAELAWRREQKIKEAYRVQRLAAKLNGERRTLHTRDGGGETVLQIHPFFYHYWGQRFGSYDCWDKTKNPEFVREILRDNPECRIKNHARPGMETLAMARNKAPVRGRRGRWAL